MVATPIANQLLRNSVPAERRRNFAAYVIAVMLTAALLVGHSIPDIPQTLRTAGWGFWLLSLLAVAGDALPVTLPGIWNTAAIYPSICFTFAIMINYGLGAAVLVQAMAVAVASWRLRHALWRGIFNFGQYAVAFGLSYLVLQLVKDVTEEARGRGLMLLALIVAATVWFGGKYLTCTTAVWLRDGGRWWSVMIAALAPEALVAGALLTLAPVIATMSSRRPEFLLLMVIPLLAVRRLAIITAEQRHLAQIDALTGLANRKALIGEVTAAINRHGRVGSHVALLLLDLDRFKNVNDALGHEVGDRLLIAVGDRLTKAVPSGDLVARLGGDEFAVVVKGLAHPGQAREMAERMDAALAFPVVLDGLPLDVCGSIGVAVYPEHGTDFATLLRHADVAMYSAKNGGDSIAVYIPEADQNSPQRLSLLADLRCALNNNPVCGGLSLYYQPQIHIASGHVIGVEALLRWDHPVRGPISPEEMIRVAEPSSVMRLLTKWVLQQAIEQLAAWSAEGLRMRAAVNVSVRDLHTGDVVDQIESLLRKYHVPPQRLQLEITESALMADPRRVLSTLTRLHRLGVGIALDDFGTGYSSLQHLRRLPFTEIKIDRSFVAGMVEDSDDSAIVRSIIDLAKSLGIRVIAEGVENEAAWRMLSQAGCEAAQGWFYARPMPAQELTGWLARTTLPAAPPAVQLPARSR